MGCANAYVEWTCTALYSKLDAGTVRYLLLIFMQRNSRLTSRIDGSLREQQ